MGKIRVLESQCRERQHVAEPHRPLGSIVHCVRYLIGCFRENFRRSLKKCAVDSPEHEANVLALAEAETLEARFKA